MKIQFGKMFNKACNICQKNSAEILVIAGVVGTVTSAVLACRGTLKIAGIMEEKTEILNALHNATKNIENGAVIPCSDGGEYTLADVKKDTAMIYVQTGIKLVGAYAPAVILGTFSILGIMTSHNILRKRNVALAAAYATIDKTFKEYRGRVVTRFGEVVDTELRYNVKSKKIKTKIIDANGDEQTVTTIGYELISEPAAISGYARYFEEFICENGVKRRNPCWENSGEHNSFFLTSEQNYANDKLKSNGKLFLNEVYDRLGLPTTKAGQVVGWVYDEKNPVGDNYVDFGLHHGDQWSDFVYGTEKFILLDFNVDGNIWELM